MDLIKIVLQTERDNYLHEYLTRRQKSSSFTEDRQREHTSYFVNLRNVKDPAFSFEKKIAMENFEV
ncbi:hypothetical protein BC936DRAFT_148254 [Jimgerdemannia flammicorona]|uniref:Uncharacterized protein n=1 Tax=Jimgerdemannia flammicorona TaxID=994334 RepID=A0A433D3F7_9FUNG|nr:hypothetical protein BC936DRAFT_148254 [Jimgerdemannia flammicorona]